MYGLIPLLAGSVVLAYGAGIRWLVTSAASDTLESARWKRALRKVHWARVLTWNWSAGLGAIANSETLAHQGLGETMASVLAARRALSSMTSPNPWVVNAAVNALINGGLYREALALDLHVPLDIDASVNAGARDAWALVRINLAESEYNLGWWTEAWNRLATLDDEAITSPLTRTALWFQRSWIAAHTARGNEALRLCERANHRHLPRTFWPEAYYTRAAALLALSRLDEAEREAEVGFQLSMRASSERNGHYLLGRILASAGRPEVALTHFDAGARHIYRGQGGDGLLVWGDSLAGLGRAPEARAAWSMAVERDPQSASAGTARGRLTLVASGAEGG